MDQNNRDFEVGSAVIYGLHGKCNVSAIETRKIGGEAIELYKLEPQKSPLARTSRAEPAIWIPVSNAKSRGLRSPMDQQGIETARSILESREYYFELKEPWHSVYAKLEACIRDEGAVGMAKVISYLHVLSNRQVLPASAVLKFKETVTRLFQREIADITGETAREMDEWMSKAMKSKLELDQ